MIGDDLIVFSGFQNGYSNVTVQNYAIDTRNSSAVWRRMDDLPVSQGITHGAFVVIGSKFYMCGGYLGGVPGPHIKTCLVYDHSKLPGSGQWSFLPDLPVGRAGAGMVYDSSTNSLVFSAGAERVGWVTTDFQNTWMLNLGNPGAGWVPKAAIPFHSNHMSYVTVKDASGKERHVFLGGQKAEDEHNGNINSNYEYDVANNAWIKLTDMTLARGHAASSTRAIGCGLIIAGGAINGSV